MCILTAWVEIEEMREGGGVSTDNYKHNGQGKKRGERGRMHRFFTAEYHQCSRMLPPPATCSMAFFHVDPSMLGGKERVLLTRLNKDYDEDSIRDVLVPLITQTSPVSLRALDWAVVNWSKSNNVVCSSAVPGQMTNIHHAYRTALAYWKRRLFDPFRRRERILLKIDGKEYDTTLGQANFALFTYETGILAYVIGHIDEIEDDMNRVSRQQKKERTEATRRGISRKRKELTAAKNNMCFAYDAPMRVTFD